MKLRTLSIRALLGGMIGLMGLVMTGLIGKIALQAYHRYDSSGRVATLSRLDKALFDAVQEFRFERGIMEQVIGIPPEESAEALRAALSHRVLVDAALAAALGELGGLGIEGLASAADRIVAEYDTVRKLRAQADRMAGQPLEARDRAFRDSFMPTSGRLPPSLDAASALIETEMRRLDPGIANLLLAKNMAWVTRSITGENMLILTRAMMGHRGLSPADLASTHVNEGRIATAWSLVQGVASRARAPADLKRAVAAADAAFFTGAFADLHGEVLDALSAGRDPQIEVNAWQGHITPAALALADVAVTAVNLMTTYAEEVASAARTEAMGFAVALIAAVMVVVSGPLVVLFRVARPITAMTHSMRQLAAGDLDTVVPCLGRGDEVGGMAAAVEVFKDGMRRNRVLTEELERLATIDGMTGIYNRRHFLVLADREWTRFLRHRRPLSLLMMDIDFFKSINDRFGHHVGDQVIVHLATLARECKRDSDVLSRIGGEEFALLLPETDIEGARAVAERLRLDMASAHLMAGRDPFSATVSIGVATAHWEDAGIVDLMKAADGALYEAKRGGRNQVVCFRDPSMADESSDLPVVHSGDISLLRTA
jgi:diguanylate cyclase (GGDEF)-like protein